MIGKKKTKEQEPQYYMSATNIPTYNYHVYNMKLTDYDTLLKDMYGLFATAQDTDDLYEKLEDYYKTCITSSGVSSDDADSYVNQIMSQLGLASDNKNTNDILNMQVTDFTVSKRSDTYI